MDDASSSILTAKTYVARYQELIIFNDVEILNSH